MSAIHAFMARDWFTCISCDYSEMRDGRLYCASNKRTIRWNPCGFGCSSFCARSKPLSIVLTLECYHSNTTKTVSKEATQ